MAKRILFYPFLFLFALILGCAPVISTGLKSRADASLSFKEVQENPEAYKGKTILWGGRIAQTLPQEDGSVLIEVLEWPLGFWNEPRQRVAFQGKFLLVVKEPLDFSTYESGKRVTIAGEIQGELRGGEIRGLSAPTYRYPVVLNKEMHVWKSHSYPYSSTPDYRTTWEYQHYYGILHY